MLRCATVVGILATAAVSVALWWKGNETISPYGLMVGGLGMCGMYTGLASPALDALFADSIATGDRSALYTAKQTCVYMASATGPLVNIILFATLGIMSAGASLRAAPAWHGMLCGIGARLRACQGCEVVRLLPPAAAAYVSRPPSPTRRAQATTGAWSPSGR